MKILFIWIWLFPLLLCSCTHYYYVSNAQNIPMLKEKNEVQLAGSLSGGDESTGIELQSAYAVTSHFGLMANFFTAWGAEGTYDTGKGSYFEAAGGYFKSINGNQEFEIYGGLGSGGEKHNYEHYVYDPNGGVSSGNGGNSHLSFVKFFIQPSYGFHNEVLEVAASARINRVSYTDIYSYHTELSVNEELNALKDKNHYFIEPAFTLRAGWKNFKFQAQISYNAYLNNPMIEFYEELHLSGGIRYTIPPGGNGNQRKNAKRRSEE